MFKPKNLQVELTNHCNLACVMCPRPSMTRSVGFMKKDLFEKIINEAKDSVTHIWLHHFGESTFHPEIIRFISYAKQAGIPKLSLSTNCAQLHTLGKDFSKNLLCSGLDRLFLCFDGYDKSTYEKFRVGATYEETVENIREILTLKEQLQSKIYLELQIIDMSSSLGKDFKEKAKKNIEALFGDLLKNCRVFFKKFDSWGNQIESISLLGNKQVKDRDFICNVIEDCNEMTILWNGDCVPCCRDFNGKIILGNLNSQSLEEIFNGPKYNELREQNRKLIYPNDLCNKCGNRVKNYIKFKHQNNSPIKSQELTQW